MARFPYYRHNVAALGRLLADARVDQCVRNRLLENPKRELQRVGLPESVTELIAFKIVDDLENDTVALPYKLNQRRLDEQDPAYLGSIASSFTRAN